MKKLLFLFTIITVLSYHNLSAGPFGLIEFRGINSEESPLLISPDKSPDMNNITISEDGLSISRRKGQKWKFEITYPTWTVKSFGAVKNNTYDMLLVGYGPHVEAYNTAYSATMIHSSATVSYVWDFARFRDGNTYATNGKDTVFYTDGNTKTFITSAPKGTSIVFYNDTCFIANTTNNKARIQYSAWSDATDWTTGTGAAEGRVVDIADYGDKITDLEVLGNGVLVLCSNSIMKMIGTQNPYQVITVDKSIGCKSKGSVSTHLGWTYFLGSDGQKYRTDGNIVENLSENEYRKEFNATALSQRTANFITQTTESDFSTGITSHTSYTEFSGSINLSTAAVDSSSITTTDGEWNNWTGGYKEVHDGALYYPLLNQTFDSPIYDLLVSSPCLTKIVLNFGTTPGINFKIRTSTDSAMGDSPSWVAQTLLDSSTGINPTGVERKRYVQLRFSSPSGLYGELQAYISILTIKWVYVNYFISPYFTTVDIKGWGTVDYSETTVNDTISVYMYSNSTITTNIDLQNVVSWTTQTIDTTISITTNTYVWYKFTFANSGQKINSMTINWISGSDTTEDMAAQWHEERLYLGVMQNTSSSSNDAVFVYDPDLNSWWVYKTGVYPSSFFKWKNTFLVASSTSGVVYEFLSGNDDNGTNIDCYYKSKYLTGTEGISPFISSLEHFTVIYSTQNSGNMKIDVYLNGSSTAADTYTIDQTANSSQDIDFNSYKFPRRNNCRYFQFKIYNDSGSNIELLGLIGEATNFPLRIQTQ